MYIYLQKQKVLKLIVIISLCFCNTPTVAQKEPPKNILFTSLLDSISEAYQIFFTYNDEIFVDKYISNSFLQKTALQEILTALEERTLYHFDNLGNGYYVIYTKEHYRRNIKSFIKVSKTKTIDKKDSKTDRGKNIFRGIIVDPQGNPLTNASVFQQFTNNGTLAASDGRFVLDIKNKKAIKVSFIGFQTKTLSVEETDFTVRHKIILTNNELLDEVYLVGSRNKSRTSINTPVAIDFIDVNGLVNKYGVVDLNQVLLKSIPSFNATKQSGADGADHIDPATLRGLGPDQTLVLINGKRRHQTSLINLYGTRGRGNSGTDLNAIPSSAIERIELLRDGASAQYGSDAIAGVINIVLKEEVNKLNIAATTGFYNANPGLSLPNSRKGIDGETYKVALNYGVKILEKGFVNFSTELLTKEHTYRPSNYYREKYGNAKSQNASLFINAEIPIQNASKVYFNVGYNKRNSDAFAFTRAADSERNVLAIYPNGFNPLITADILDKSVSLGFVTKLKGWVIDINNTVGKNNFQYFIKETLNATLEENSPSEFDAGGHQLIQNTTSIDFSKLYNNSFHGLNLAFGLEYRLENYQIFSGEEGSYAQYDIYGDRVTAATPSEDLTRHNNIVRPAGSQGFPGYSPENEVNKSRANFSFYSDTEIDLSEKLMIGTAVRYEHYSDFGSTLNFKLSSRLRVLTNLNLRSSFSTGFRAPSLAQIYYNLTFTNFIGSVATESLLIANNNPLARAFNIKKLNEEKARNASLGFTAKANHNFSAIIDAYWVEVKDRIILSGNFDATNLNENVDHIQFFANGVDTKTMGLDVRLNWHKNFEKTQVSVSLSGNINQMKIKKIHHKDLDPATFFGVRERHFLLASAPKNKFNLELNYQYKKVSATLSFTRFSEVLLTDWQIQQKLSNFDNSEDKRMQASMDHYAPKITTDMHLRYQFSKALNFQIGSHNLFNIYPSIQDPNTDSGGFWDSTQMGSNGAFFYTRIQYSL